MPEYEGKNIVSPSPEFLSSDPINNAVLYLPPVRWTPEVSYNVPTSKYELTTTLDRILPILDLQLYSMENKRMTLEQFLKFHSNFANMTKNVRRNHHGEFENWLKEKREQLEGEWTAICVERKSNIADLSLQEQLSSIKGESPPNVYGVIHPESLLEYPMVPWNDKLITPLRFILGDRTQSDLDSQLVIRYFAIHIPGNFAEATKSARIWQRIE